MTQRSPHFAKPEEVASPKGGHTAKSSDETNLDARELNSHDFDSQNLDSPDFNSQVRTSSQSTPPRRWPHEEVAASMRREPDPHKSDLRESGWWKNGWWQTGSMLSQPLLSKTSISDMVLANAAQEADREIFYQLELLHLFRQRLQLVAFLGLLLLPIFHIFYLYLSPQVAQQTRITHLLMASVCILFLLAPAHITDLKWARLSAVIGYVLMCLGSSMIMVILAQNQFEQTSISGLQLAMLAAHSQILVSIVLLPITLWESLVMTLIITVSLAWSSWWTVPYDGGTVQTSQIFVLITTAIFVLCLAHFQAVLRRRAFNATFDLALSVAQMQTLSIRDAVTGGYNRLYLERNLELEINRTARFSRPISVMMFDLDNFKNVNDTQGHTAGDEVLRVVNQAAGLAVRDVDTLARYGGDEFMVVLPETDQEDALAVAERLQICVRDQLQSSFGAQTPEGQVTLSVGVVTLHLCAPTSTDSIIARADERLYEAKRMGKNRIAI